jgi:lipopolysaccharide/colanic/teichoic acid biosynthesis glycosyltransferase/NDP-sugar pyrophosphorylase family protein
MTGVCAAILAGDSQPWLTEYAIEVRVEPRLLNVGFAQWQVEALRAGGVQDTWFVHLRNAAFAAPPGARVRAQPLPLGTAGAIADLRDELAGRSVLVCYGSAFIDPGDVRALLSAGADKPGWGAIVGVIDPPVQMGARETLVVDTDGQLREIYRGHISHDRRNLLRPSGLVLLAPEALRCIPGGRYFDLKEQLFPMLRAAGLRIDTMNTVGTFPVVSPEDYLRVQFDLLNNDLGPGNRVRPAARVPASARVHADARLSGRVNIGADCEIAQGTHIIGPVLIGMRCRIETGATIVGPAVLGDNCRLGKDAIVQCSVLDDGVLAAAGSNVRFSLLGKDHKVRLWDSRYYIDALCSRANGTPRSGSPALRRNGMGRSGGALDFGRGVLDLASKRAFDIVIALALLLLTTPLWIYIMIAISLDSPGPVLFNQRRCGLNGKEFWMIKFRTMVADAEDTKPLLQKINEVDGPMFKLNDDPRITRVGRFLRKTSLDELPQVINVLKNEMSLVGPRPLAIGEMGLDPHWRDARLSVKPGITGSWQVYGRTSRAFHRWITLDIEYVRKRSFWFDLKIIAKTLMVIFRGK